MRTVDPEQWSRQLKKPRINGTRCNQFGQHPGLRYEKIFRESFVDAAVEFRANCSIPIVKYINMEGVNTLERYCYISLLFLSLGSGIMIFSYNCQEFLTTSPLEISLLSPAPLTDVTFPAVALCSNNIISKPALLNYTEYLFNHLENHQRPNPYSRSELEKNLQMLGALLFFTQPSLQYDFDQFLSNVDRPFNVTDVMFRLAPPCSSLLERCSWRGRVVPCESLFAARITPLGFCCVFNSRYYATDAKNKPQALDLTGVNYGLGLVVTENSDDFMYWRRNWDGAEMLLFEGSEYPLLESGDVRLFPVPRRQALALSLRVTTQRADHRVKYFGEEHRGCRTEAEERGGCLARCRRHTAAALCGCVPYTLQAARGARGAGARGAGARGGGRRECMLRDLSCLSKHREKFLYVYPHTAHWEDPQISEELKDGMDCPECRVSCARRLYDADVSYIDTGERATMHRNFLTKGLSLVNSTTILLFYTAGHHRAYWLEAYMTWYEALAFVSTQWMIVAGTPIVVVLELLYFGTFRWMHHVIRRTRLANLRAPSI